MDQNIRITRRFFVTIFRGYVNKVKRALRVGPQTLTLPYCPHHRELVKNDLQLLWYTKWRRGSPLPPLWASSRRCPECRRLGHQAPTSGGFRCGRSAALSPARESGARRAASAVSGQVREGNLVRILCIGPAAAAQGKNGSSQAGRSPLARI